jgi:hypothetical protein
MRRSARNGAIFDQGGPGGGGPLAGGPNGIPALGEWALLVLMLLLGFAGARRLRKT